MSLYLEITYAKVVGQQLERFTIKKESPFHGAARCPICGDSAKKKTLTRFHILEKDNKLMVFCHNCSYSHTFVTFLKNNHHNLYSEFAFQKYRDSSPNVPVITTKPVVSTPRTRENALGGVFTLGIPYVRDLPEEHVVRAYVTSRKLPKYPFQVTDRFFAFAAQFNEELDKKVQTKDELRLVIPFFDRKGNVFAFQGRDMSGKSAQKYITIIVDKKVPKIFGVDRIDLKKPVKIVEGPLDSLFLENCLASVNASLVSTAKKLSSALNKTLVTLVYDNENRNKTIVSMYADAIKQGYNIVIWPKLCQGLKDINDMVLAGLNPEDIISKNTFSGLRAQIEFDNWKKV